MVKLSLVLVLFMSLIGCASAERLPSGEAIPSGSNTIVLASKKSAKVFFRELKKRVVEKNFYFLKTDLDTRSFVTDFYDVHKRSSVQLQVYVKNVKGGSNAIITGKYIDLKKLKKYPWYRAKRISYQKKGKAAQHAWDAFYNFGVGSQKWKYTLLKY